MSVDQLLTLLAVLAWPLVALIAALALHAAIGAIGTLVADLQIRQHNHERWRLGRITDTLFVMAHDTLPDLVTICMARFTAGNRVAATAERALLTVLAANGGIPGKRSDGAVRQLVREVRKMYEEIRRPTPEPSIVEREESSEEDELLEGLFGPAMTDDDVDTEDAHAEFIEED